MTERLQRIINESRRYPDILHQSLFFSLCRDLNDLTIHQNSIESNTILDLVEEYSKAEWEAQKP
jgi:hypothetical protein